MMEYRRLGRTELHVSVIGFGTSQLRLVPEKQALDTLIRGFELGVNLVHTAPDYEGAEDLVARAIRETPREVCVCTQAYDVHGNSSGPVDHFERLFEESCERFNRNRLKLFGIACIDDREALGENVWGRNGMVEFLQKKKEEGRIGATYCTTHGDVDYVRNLLDLDVFDALMLAYNPLGFHLLSFSPPEGRRFEDLPRTRSDIFPLVQEKDVGLLIMKPLAGGLLCDSLAFPPRTRNGSTASQLTVRDVLRSILNCPGVGCVVPGTASIEEAEENALAGHAPLTDSDDAGRHIAARVRSLQATVCSRCGICDNLCSRSLPVSWLFRAAYISLHSSETFETWEEVEYFRLHPQSEAVCTTCDNVTCKCPHGIDIPRSLSSLHGHMVMLCKRGLVRPPVSGREPSVGSATFGARVLLKDVPTKLTPFEKRICRLYVENAGSCGWLLRPHKHRQASVRLVALFDGQRVAEVPLRHTVLTGGRAHFVFELMAPAKKGRLNLRLALIGRERPFSFQRGLVLHDGDVEVRGGS